MSNQARRADKAVKLAHEQNLAAACKQAGGVCFHPKKLPDDISTQTPDFHSEEKFAFTHAGGGLEEACWRLQHQIVSEKRKKEETLLTFNS